MSGLGLFFAQSKSYETSLIETTRKQGHVIAIDVAQSMQDGQRSGPAPTATTATSIETAFMNYRLQLKQEMLDYMRYRIFGDEFHPEYPHINKAISAAQDIAELNLNVKVLNLSLCRIEKIWPFRSCRRGQTIVADRKYLQLDGPISTLYRSVLSFEVLQCFEKPPSELAVRIRNLHGNHHSHRCRVFMYGNYATAMTRFLGSLKENDQVFCSFRRVPARCIFRYQNIDWVDTKEKYCLGIGDDSAAERAGGRERFDSEDMIIELARVDSTNIVLSEFQIRRLDDGIIALERISESRLMFIFKAYLAKEDSSAANANQANECPGDESGSELGNEPVNLQSVTLAELPVLFETAELIDARGGARQRRRVDITAVALSFTQPYRTKRGDLTMSITVIDDSLQLCDNDGTNNSFIKSNNINIFVGYKMGYLLPKLRESGDVVLMRNLELDKFNGEIQLVGHKRGSASYTCYRRDDNATGSSPTTVMEKDGFSVAEAKRLDELWVWGQKRLRLHATMKQEHRFRIRDMLPQKDQNIYGNVEAANRGDMFALISAIIPWDDEFLPPPRPKGFLRVWDGTGESTSDNLPLESAAALQAVTDGDPSDLAVMCVADVVRRLRADNQGTSLRLPGALAGRVVNVAIWESQHWALAEKGYLKVGQFIRMRNIVETMSQRLLGIRCLNVQTKSSFTITPPLTYEVVKLIEEHNQRVVSGEPTNPASGVLPLEMDEDRNLALASLPRNLRKESVNSPTPSRLLKGASLRIESLHKYASAPHGALFDGIVRLRDIFPPLEQAHEKGLEKVFCRKTMDADPTVYFQFAVCVEQDSAATVLDAIVCDKGKRTPIGPLLFSSSAEEAIKDPMTAMTNLQKILSTETRWKALIKSTIVDGKRFFLLSSLVPLD